MFGIDGASPKILGKHDWLPRIHPEDIPVVQGELENAGRRNEIYAARFRAIRPDGSHCQILGIGRTAARDKRRFVGLNFDLAAMAATADLESRRAGGTVAGFTRSLTVHPGPANENEAQRGRPRYLQEKSSKSRRQANKEGACQKLLERALATTKLQHLCEQIRNPAIIGKPEMDTFLALYVTHAAAGILSRNREAHAARMDTIHKELGQRLTALSLAVGAIEAGGEIADAVGLVRMAVEEARDELKFHRHEARQEVLP